MNKHYVKQYGFLESTHWWFIVRQKIILQVLRKFETAGANGNVRILNVGAASGGSTKWLSALGRVVSLENDPLFLAYLKEGGLDAVSGSVTDIPLQENSVDLVCAFDVLEHVSDDERAFAEMVRVCKPNGTICITVPAFQSLWGNHDVVNGHYRRYKKEQIGRIVKSQCVTTLYSSYFNSILFIPIFLLRKFQSFFKNNGQKSESDFAYFKTNNFANKIFKFLFGLEFFLLKIFRFPIGVSLLMVFKKDTLGEIKPH